MKHRQVTCTAFFLAVVSLASCASTEPKSSMSTDDARVWNAAREQHGVGALDDRAFDIKLSPKGSDVSQPDVIEFAGGRMHSRGCDDFGFGTSTYTSQPVSGGVEFHVLCKSSSGATNDWKGTVRGDAIQGTMTWTPGPGDPGIEHTFAGHATTY